MILLYGEFTIEIVGRELRKGDTPGLVKFPTDKALLQDPVFRRYVQIYAQVRLFKLAIQIIKLRITN